MKYKDNLQILGLNLFQFFIKQLPQQYSMPFSETLYQIINSLLFLSIMPQNNDDTC